MSFTPALFKNFGKSVKDLFDSKKYNTDKHQLVVRNKSSNGITLTHTTDVNANVASELKLNYKNAAHGSAEIVGNTNGVTGKLKLNKLQPGVEVEINAADNAKGVSADATINYVKDMVAASVGFGLLKPYEANASVAVGVDNVSVGASVKATSDAEGKLNVSDYNGAFQYEQSDLTVTVVTANKADQVNLSLNQVVSKDVVVAAQASFNFSEGAKGNNSLTAGGSVVLDSATNLKGKLSHKGDLAVNFEHTFRPFAKVGVVSAFNVTGSNKAAFGVTLTLGETSE